MVYSFIQGLTLTAQGVEDGLFIKEMIPMAGGNSFVFSGPMEDVWTALQVQMSAELSLICPFTVVKDPY